jgi:hypothetical protein
MLLSIWGGLELDVLFEVVFGETAESFVLLDCWDPGLSPLRMLSLFGLAFGLPILSKFFMRILIICSQASWTFLSRTVELVGLFLRGLLVG